jgi:hypothetical protein
MASATISTQGKALYAWSGSEWIPLNGGTNFSTIQRWNKIFDGGETIISGNDENDNLLIYTPGYEQVYLNGILLVRNEDYTATDGVEINLSSPLNENDVLDIIIFIPLNIGNVYSKQQSDLRYATLEDLNNIDLSSASAAAVDYLTDGAPEALDTLLELSAALDDDPNFYSTIQSVYLTQSSASSTYLTQSSASTTYLTQSSASSTYLTQSSASSSYASRLISSVSASTAYQLVLSDVGKVIEVNSSSSVTVTVPDNTTVAFPIGSIINIYRQGTGTVTISGASGVTVRNAGTIVSQFGERSLRKRDTNEWVLV